MTWTTTLIVIFTLGLAAGVAALDGAPVGVFHDDAIYVILARALATGAGYRYLNLPGAPAAIHYPPGYPALLAMLWKVAPGFPANVVLFKSVNLLLLAVAAVLATRLTRVRLGDARAAIAVGVLSAVSVPTLTLGSMVLSEPLFLAMLLALLVLAERLCDATVKSGAVGPPESAGSDAYVAASRHSSTASVLVGAGIGALALVRSHGIVLAPAVGLVLAARGRWRHAALVVGTTIVVMLPWQFWSATHARDIPPALQGVYGSYTGWLAAGIREMGLPFILDTLRNTSRDLGGMFTALFSPLRSPVGHTMTLAALALLASGGSAVLFRRAPVSLLFGLGYLALTLAWPFPPARFVWAIWPLVLVVLVAGAFAALPNLPGASGVRRSLRVATLVAACWLAVGYAMYEVRAIRGRWWGSVSRAERRRIEPAIAWTLARTGPGDIVASEDDAALFLYTNRRTVPVLAASARRYVRAIEPREDAEAGLIPIIEQFHPAAVLVGSTGPIAVAELLSLPPYTRVRLLEHFAGGAAFTVIAP